MLIRTAMFGGLHMELAVLKTAENRLESSGRPGEVVHAGVASCGKAYSFLKASHVTPTR